MIGLESDKNYSTGHSINGNLAEKKRNGEEKLAKLTLQSFQLQGVFPPKTFQGQPYQNCRVVQ